MPDKETLLNRVNSFPYWYHKIELPYEIITPGLSPINADSYLIPENLQGKRVLDVGAWDGFWTFEALKRGAEQVVAIDDFSDFLGFLDNSARKTWETFDFCKEIFEYTDTQCQRIEMSVYDVTPENLGFFDIIFFFGTIYHLRHPLLALDKLSAVCKKEIYVESAVLDHFSPYRGGFGFGYPGGQMVMEFYPGKEYGNNNSNWWVPTLTCLGNMVCSAGFPKIRTWQLSSSPPKTIGYCRGFVKGVKQE